MRVIKPADKYQPPQGLIITTELLSIHLCANPITLRQHLRSSRHTSAAIITCPRKTSTRSIICSSPVPISAVPLGSEVKELLVVVVITPTLPISNSFWASNRTSNHITQHLVRCNNKPWFRRLIATQNDEKVQLNCLARRPTLHHFH